jgi:hypothetical protein
MSAVEAQARKLLRWFPSRWRTAHGEALIGTLLDAADAAERTALTPNERRDLIVSGLRERGLALVPASVRRQAAPIALGVGLALAVLQFVTIEWAPWSHPAWQYFSSGPVGLGPFNSAGVIMDALWLAAFMLGLLRLRRTMIAALGASVLVGVALYFAPATSWSVSRPSASAIVVMALLAAAASSAPLTGRSFRPLVFVAAAVAGIAIVGGLWGNFPHAGWDASSLLFGQLDASRVGAVILVPVVLLGLVGLHRSAQAVLLAVGPAWVVLLARSLTADVLWIAVIAVAITVTALTVIGGRVRWRLRVEWPRTPAE